MWWEAEWSWRRRKKKINNKFNVGDAWWGRKAARRRIFDEIIFSFLPYFFFLDPRSLINKNVYTLSAQSSVWGLWTLWNRPSGVYVSLPTVNKCKSLWRIHDTCLIKKNLWVMNIYAISTFFSAEFAEFLREYLHHSRGFSLKLLRRV